MTVYRAGTRLESGPQAPPFRIGRGSMLLLALVMVAGELEEAPLALLTEGQVVLPHYHTDAPHTEYEWMALTECTAEEAAPEEVPRMLAEGRDHLRDAALEMGRQCGAYEMLARMTTVLLMVATPNGKHRTVEGTQARLAMAVGMRRESLATMLGQLNVAEIISTRYRKIILLHEAALQRLASGESLNTVKAEFGL